MVIANTTIPIDKEEKYAVPLKKNKHEWCINYKQDCQVEYTEQGLNTLENI